MIRLRAPSGSLVRGARVALGEAGARHAHVLRLAVADPIVAFDGEGREAACTVVTLSPTELVVEVGEVTTRAFATLAPTLVQCVPKGSKLDDVVRAATEAGVYDVHLAISARSIARAEGRLDRLARIAEEAARQSEAPRVPIVHAPAPLTAVVARAPADATRIALDARRGTRLRELVRPGAPCWLVVGPEGGLDEGELDGLVAGGWAVGRLDTHVLRTEHAGPIAIAVVREIG